MDFPEFGDENCCALDTHEIARPTFGPALFMAFAIAAIVCLGIIVSLVDQRDAAEQKCTVAETENAGLLDRNQAANAEIKRLRSEHSAMRDKLIGARTRVRDLERYIDEQKRIHGPPDVPECCKLAAESPADPPIPQDFQPYGEVL